ncbi:hypothetical protein CAPTEDRAFT_117034 [Capitella teleta]|uniref:F5/8 type C domain-containing protein n=1 Tax=Capitella teleta TaxID=283909 RepID=R7TPY3_CAPTE|nr:hypothetical protein CAPTEDRAFT_117034 [Capitella teleta]|eukprot:ELT93100.1 hypothetical protein CAPTEDRAFT_117034 [Capitella teleta]
MHSNEEALISGEIFVPDARMTASSQWSMYVGPERARIDTVVQGSFKGAWESEIPQPGEWIQVEFSASMIVQSVKTRGRSDVAYWVTSYELHFSQDGLNWEAYQEPYGTIKVFSGNNDQNTPVEHFLQAAIRAKYVRIVALTFKGAVSLRFELYGSHYSGRWRL